MKKIEVLVFEGCPNVDAALDEIRAALAATNEAAETTVVRVESDEAAARLRFLGSPTVRVDGVDVDSSSRDRDDYGLQCRVYAVGGRLRGAPPAEWIASALRGEARQEDGAAAPDDAATAKRGRCC